MAADRHRFDLAAIAPTPWKNGGGCTRELACWPPGAGMDAFEWRVSVATIAAPGPFSAFAGVQRQIMLLDGDGVRLRTADGAAHTLDRRWRPVAFPGEAALDCAPLGGSSTDLNLMLRRGRWQGALQVLHGPSPGGAPAGLGLVLAGTWRSGDDAFGPGQGLWWGEPDGAGEALAPLPDGDGPPALAWIALVPDFTANRPMAQAAPGPAAMDSVASPGRTA
jgi:environmental stress-induced protein Ves